MMRWLAILSLALGLVACSTSPESNLDPERAARSAKIHTELATAYLERGQYRVALEESEKAIRLNPDYSPAYNIRALIHMTLREDAEAERDFFRSVDVDPSNSDAQNNYGWFLCQHGRAKDGIEHLMKAAKDPLYETPEKAYLNAGACSMQYGSRADAERYFQNAMVMHPNLPGALIGLAQLSFINGDYAGAKSYFVRYEKSAGAVMTAEYLFLAVRIERGLGNRKASSNYATRLTSRYPDSREVQLLKQLK